ncbi:hypothetical protein KIH27_02095 [Mycobacterium sp. M1]|uniref:Uncharacterized protein n=1 Tax=Mycolicibacter acidiphilus TaxID=2835306 RepID=A0ABS5RDL5_9MYCO|nr:hypothetical protein [Mycolicibacter acidiphilus]MBS9532376.1 hypothetical protein [Mycolicibacter acidiphilus]
MTGQNFTNNLLRDGRDRPLIRDPETGELVPYQRVTTFISGLESSVGLEKWRQRELAKTLSSSPAYAKAINAADGDTKKITAVVRGALADARLSLKADTGSYLHYVLECDDRAEMGQ